MITNSLFRYLDITDRLLALVNVIVLISAYESFHCLIQVCPREVKMADHIIDQRIRTYFNQGLTQEEMHCAFL